VIYESAAHRLRDVYAGAAIPPLRDILAPNDAEVAYTVQAQLGVDQPDFGVLFGDMGIEDGTRSSPRACSKQKPKLR
jgi:2-keto-4-pentenoate hydratase